MLSFLEEKHLCYHAGKLVVSGLANLHLDDQFHPNLGRKKIKCVQSRCSTDRSWATSQHVQTSWYWNSSPTPSVSWKQRSNTTFIRKQSKELSNVVRTEKWILGFPGVCISVYVYPRKWFTLCICSDLQVKQAHARGQGESYTPNTQIQDNDISLD